ncbi:MAG: PQQ-like beta-propeller repeat protein [Alphaproteobacteria bacterium]|nr:PQQ-like beta-propeller repeat protein [Alphaproteobacteria bacterium]
MQLNKIAFLMVGLGLLAACDSHDPILPGTRTSIFDTSTVRTADTAIKSLPDTAYEMAEVNCPYTQDSTNTIWNGERKIFTGFPTTNSVKNDAKPVCSGKFVYAGLTTGELIKINPNSRQIVWIADIYRPSNMTGGASVLDIVAPIVIRGSYVYAGGLGDAFCKINAGTGAKKWCVDIGTAKPFIIAGDVIFVVATDGKLYALRDSDGAAYWSAEIEKQKAPKYENGTITVGHEKFDGVSGKKIK